MSKKIIGDKRGITLRERIIMELEYFKKTGQHLDIRNITLCSGSRWSDGNVPDANWGGSGRFYVGRYHADDRNGSIRAREQLKTLPLSLVPFSDLEIRVKKLEDFKEKVERIIKL